MLEEIFIENLAVIEKASVGFTEGLNVFTGETGAGKSILINGINALLGQRVTKDIVRTGEKKAGGPAWTLRHVCVGWGSRIRTHIPGTKNPCPNRWTIPQ